MYGLRSVSNILIKKATSLICLLRAFQVSSVLQFKSQCCSVIAAFHSKEFKSSILLQRRSPGNWKIMV